MKWEEYYDKFYDWAETTQITYISKIKSFEGADSAEVCEIAQAFLDEKIASRLLGKAIAGGVQFTADEIVDLVDYVDRDSLHRLVFSVKGSFTKKHTDILYDFVDDEVLRKIGYNHHVEISAEMDDFVEDERIQEEEKTGLGFGFLAAIWLLFGGGGKNKDQPFQIGERVRVRYRGQEGVIIDKNRNYYMVSINDGEFVDSYLASDLEKAW